MIPTSETSISSVTKEEASIDLRQYLALFRQWWWLVVLVTLLAGAAGYLISKRMTPVYQASTTLMINQAASNQTTDYNSILSSERLTSTYAQMITTRPVLEETIKRLDLSMTPEKLGETITVTPVRDTQLLTISVENADPKLSALIANTMLQVFSEQLKQTQSTRFSATKDSIQKQMTDAENEVSELRSSISKTKDPLESADLQSRLTQYQQMYSNLLVSYNQIIMAEAQTNSNVVQVERAVAESKPVKPKTMMNTLMAALMGLMLSAGGVFAYDALDDTVKNPDEITRQLKLTVMGTIPHYEQPEDGQLIVQAQPRSPVAESFRALRTNVQYASVDTPIRTLLVTSTAPSDGKTTTTSNLAVSIAHANRQVTLIDADLHRPRVHQVLKTESRPGLSSLFIRPTIHLNGEFQSTALKNLHVISAGELPPNPTELLGSNKMREIISTVLEKSDMVLIDTPPVLAVTDAVVLSPLVDGVLIVVKPGVTKMTALRHAVEQLRYVGANIIGVVINGVNSHSSRYGYYYRSYDYKQYKYYGGNGSAQSRQENSAKPVVVKKEVEEAGVERRLR